MAITPNTTCDIYRAGNAPPAAPDFAQAPCYIVFCYDQGREHGEQEQQQFRYLAKMLVAPDLDIRDDFNDWQGQASNRDTVYVPDQNGIPYAVSFVERNNRGGPADAKCVYLDRKSVNWPWPGAPGQPGAILPPPNPPAPPGGNLQLEAGMGPSQPISALTPASSVTDNDLAVIVQGGANLNVARSILVGSANNTFTGYQPAVYGFTQNDQGSGDSNITSVGNFNSVSGTGGTACGMENFVVKTTDGYSSALGCYNYVNGYQCNAVGNNNWLSSCTNSATFGIDNYIYTADSCFILGTWCTINRPDAVTQIIGATALGYRAATGVNYTVNIGGAIIIQPGTGAGGNDCIWAFSGAEAVIFSENQDWTTTGNCTLVLPDGCVFSPSECGLMVTDVDTLTVQPTIQFGDEIGVDDLVASVQTTNLTAPYRYQKYRGASIRNEDGHTTLSATVATQATANVFTGRFYWKGILVQK